MNRWNVIETPRPLKRWKQFDLFWTLAGLVLGLLRTNSNRIQKFQRGGRGGGGEGGGGGGKWTVILLDCALTRAPIGQWRRSEVIFSVVRRRINMSTPLQPLAIEMCSGPAGEWKRSSKYFSTETNPNSKSVFYNCGRLGPNSIWIIYHVLCINLHIQPAGINCKLCYWLAIESKWAISHVITSLKCVNLPQ